LNSRLTGNIYRFDDWSGKNPQKTAEPNTARQPVGHTRPAEEQLEAANVTETPSRRTASERAIKVQIVAGAESDFGVGRLVRCARMRKQL